MQWRRQAFQSMGSALVVEAYFPLIYVEIGSKQGLKMQFLKICGFRRSHGTHYRTKKMVSMAPITYYETQCLGVKSSYLLYQLNYLFKKSTSL